MEETFDKFPGNMAGWALDFPRAIANRPLWARILFWFVLGEAGRHEFWGLAWAIRKCGLELWEPECEYRSDKMDKMPLFWREVEPQDR